MNAMSAIEMDRAVRPNLFDVAAQPALTFALTLANMMSSRLWDMADAVRHRPTTDRMLALHKYVNGHFAHVLPWDMSEQWGIVDLDAERARLGAEAVDAALETITVMFDLRARTDTMPPRADVRPLIEDGKFPAYFYSTVDEAIACRRLMRHKKHKPMGRTSCLDEGALIAAALCLFAGHVPAELAFLASDFHYSVVELDLDDPVWFNAKKDYFSRSEWREHARRSDDHGQFELDKVLYVADRVIAPSGTCHLTANWLDMPPDLADRLLSEIRDFFGPELRQMATLRRRDDAQVVVPEFRDRFVEVLPASGADDVRRSVARIASEQPGGVCAAAQYCYRTMDVADPRPYLRAAVRAVGRTPSVDGIATIEQAREHAASVTGAESILADRWRIATPDEVVHYDTGSDRDRALLLYAYASRLSDGRDADHLAIHFTERGSYVHDGNEWCDAMTGEVVAEPPDAPLAVWRLG